MNEQSKHISFVSSSFLQTDRRMQRIIKSLSSKYKIRWISRSMGADRVFDDSEHTIFNTIFKRGVLFYLEMNMRLFIKLVLSRTDIISAVDLDVLPACFLVSMLRNKKLVFDSHELFHEVPELQSKTIKKAIWRSLSKFLFPKIRYSYTVNNSLKNIFEKEFNSSFQVVRNLAPVYELRSMPSSEDKKLVYLGVINKGRGVELAVKALCELEEYTLDILGLGDEMDQVEALVGQLKLQDRVNFHGFVEPETISEILNNSSIALNVLDPSSDNYKYSLANKFFDYVHAGLPSVNMRFNEYQSLNAEFEVSHLIDEYSTEAVVEAVRYIEQDHIYLQMQSECLKARESWNWQSESQKLMDIYDQAFMS